MPSARSRMVGSYLFGSVLLFFVLGVFVLAPDQLPPYKHRILALTSAILAALFGYFLTGSVGLKLDSLRSKLGNITVDATGGLALFVLVLVWWLSPLAPVGTGDGLFTVRTTVLGQNGVPVDDAEVWSSIGGEGKRVAGGWEFEIPESKLPADRRLVIFASRKTQFEAGKEEVRLNKDRLATATIRLVRETSGIIRGTVATGSGIPIDSATVAIVGTQESTTTNPQGFFELRALAAAGQEVRLRVTKSGYRDHENYHPIGDTPVYVVLDKP